MDWIQHRIKLTVCVRVYIFFFKIKQRQQTKHDTPQTCPLAYAEPGQILLDGAPVYKTSWLQNVTKFMGLYEIQWSIWRKIRIWVDKSYLCIYLLPGQMQMKILCNIQTPSCPVLYCPMHHSWLILYLPLEGGNSFVTTMPGLSTAGLCWNRRDPASAFPKRHSFKGSCLVTSELPYPSRSGWRLAPKTLSKVLTVLPPWWWTEIASSWVCKKVWRIIVLGWHEICYLKFSSINAESFPLCSEPFRG